MEQTSSSEIIPIHTLILGAGPAGLAAAYALTKAEKQPVIIEKEKISGGLMRSIKHGEFVVDIGRKELYTRIPKVDALWTEILGPDYVSYNHREGILYKNKILESNKMWRGFLRGMPVKMALTCLKDFIWDFSKFSLFKPHNYEEYCYKKRGQKFSQIFTQGYEEKFKGIQWREMCVPTENSNAIDQLATQHNAEREKMVWRHPAKGSGQICEVLENKIIERGGKFVFGGKIVEFITTKKHIAIVKVAVDSKIISYQPKYVVSSMPIQLLSQYLNQYDAVPNKNQADTNVTKTQSKNTRSTICVYLFLNETPRFPHVWLKVTCPTIKAGRITNYAALSKAMVPNGKTGLCVEYFCSASDPLISLDDDVLKDLALSECAKSGLIDSNTYLDSFVLKLPGANASINWKDWDNEPMQTLFKTINEYENLYNINRPGTDKATYAGLEAASAILNGNKKVFNKEVSLTLPNMA